jgi:hypothetical protein
MSRGAEDVKQSQRKRKCTKKKEEKRTCGRQLIHRECEESGENYENG